MKYVHTNLITSDWKRLAGFYVQVFGCKLILPQRHLSGDWLSKGTGVDNAQINGAHLRLPGYGDHGPTLELFEYKDPVRRPTPVANEKGFGHLAFEVDDVKTVLEKVLAFGGKHYGEIVQHPIPGVGQLTFVYTRDPDGNILELQHWERDETTQENPPFEVVVQDSPKAEQKTVTPTANTQEEVDEVTVPMDKRAYLNSLQNDLDQADRDQYLTKAEIRAMKEEARQQKNHIKRGLQYDPDQPMTIKKTKEELLEELKNEDKTILPKDKVQSDLPPPPTVQSHSPLLTLPEAPATLLVELQFDNGHTQNLALNDLELGLEPTRLAEQLRAFITVGYPEQPEYSFLQHLGKQYRADLVPLIKHKRPDATINAQKEAWILVPRLRDSLRHFTGQLNSQPSSLEAMKVERLGLTPTIITAAYQALQIIVQAAEKQEAQYLRLSYTA